MKIEVKIERATGAAILKTGDWYDRDETMLEAYVKQGQHTSMSRGYWRESCRTPKTIAERILAAQLLVEYAQLTHYTLKMHAKD